MKQKQRLFIVAFLYLALFSIVLTSCRTRKVNLDIEKSSNKSKTEESSEVKEDTKIKIEDKSKTTVTENDLSKTVTEEETEITADEVIQDKDGKTVYKGNVKVKGKKNTSTQNNKKNVSESLKNVNTDISQSKDSVGIKKAGLEKENVKKKKDTSAESVSIWAILTPVGILLLLAFIAVKWNALKRLFNSLFGLTA